PVTRTADRASHVCSGRGHRRLPAAEGMARSQGVRTGAKPMTWLMVVAVASASLVAAVWFGQRQLIYLPSPDLAPVPGDVSVLTAETSDGVRHQVWLVPADDRPIARAVVFNGNA